LRLRLGLGALLGVAALTIWLATATGGHGSVVGRAASSSPIQHVVIVFQENHSFDEVLGGLCVRERRCSGTVFGRLASGGFVQLKTAPDVVPNVTHKVAAQTASIDGGRMDGFSTISGCTASTNYACYEQQPQGNIPNLWALAESFTIADHTFELGPVPSWGGHLDLVAAQTDGFTGDNPPSKSSSPTGSGWGCDSLKDAAWQASPGSPVIKIPSCIPQQDGSGPYKPSPAKWIPTIMDRLEGSGLSWEIDAPKYGQAGYTWSICPSFADCLYTEQAGHVQGSGNILTAAQTGTLPSVSIVIPGNGNSQHNLNSMTKGDNWIGSVVSAIMHGPEWGSTAIFITYDDFGGFYDHMAPPSGLGIRVPMVIVSPYARARTTDSNTASYASMLAFIEHNFNLAPLGSADASAYDFSNSFNFHQAPLAPITLAQHPISTNERAWLAAHPPPPDDPT
jgi:phospholipase C